MSRPLLSPGFALAIGLACAAPVLADDCAGFLIDGEGIYQGSLCLDARPERVVILDASFSLGTGLDVGLPIVGAPLSGSSNAGLRELAQERGVADLGLPSEPSLERIAALQPDLILAYVGNSGLADAYYPIFSQIAPTLFDTSLDWQGYYHRLARLAGSETDVDALISEFEARLAELATRVPQDRTVSIVRITSWDFQVYLDGPDVYAPFALVHHAGVERSQYEQGEDPSGLFRPDWEELEGLDGDVLLYIVGGTNNSDSDGRHEEVLNHPLWQMLPAVQSGQVYRIDHAHWMEFNGLGSAHRVLDDIEQYVIGTP